MGDEEKGIGQRFGEGMQAHLRRFHGANSIKPSMLSCVEVEVYDDDSRPAPGSVNAGRVIFNVSDNSLNVSDGTNWRDMAGNVT